MPSEESISVTAHLTLIQTIDDQVPASDPHRLSKLLRDQVDADLKALENADGATTSQEVNRTEKSAALRDGLAQLELLVRNGYNAIGAIRATVITEVERASVYASYGWTGGLLGRMSDDRIVALARIGCREHTEVNPAFRYSPELVTDLKKALAEYDQLTPHPVAAAAGNAVQSRNEKLEAAAQTLSQVRYWYCAASRQTTKNPELVKIGFQPRRKPRSKETIEAANKRKDAQRSGRETKRLQEIELEEQEALARLKEAVAKVRTKAAKARAEILGEESGASASAAGDVTLSS